MLKWLGIVVGTFRSALRSQQEFALETLALRQQPAAVKLRHPRPRLTNTDRVFWVLLSRVWRNWRKSLHIVRADTVVRWHRQGFRYYWRWKSRGRGRPKIDRELRRLIRQMCRATPLWGAPRIHGELLKLGIEISEATVSRYMIRRRGPPCQSWRSFLDNHARELISMDFFTVPSATFRVLFVLVILNHDRRRIIHFNVTAHPTPMWTARQLVEAIGEGVTLGYLIPDRDRCYGRRFSRQAAALGIREVRTAPRSPWQNAYAERVIGSIRREFLDHVIVLGERHLRRMMRRYVRYYNGTRTHLSLENDAPETRFVQPPCSGRVVALPRVGGLHHEYIRLAA